jgi:hypothetical protein
VVFDYQTTRASKYQKQFLEGFKGKLHVDGYKDYEGLPGITFLGVGLMPGENLMRHKRQLLQHKEGN